MSAALKAIIELPFKISSAFDRLGNTFEAHQFLIRQPEHCTVTQAIFLQWPEHLPEAELARPETVFEEQNVTPRFQTFWSLYQDLDVLTLSHSEELIQRLNLKLKPEHSWLLLVSFRVGLGNEVFVCPVGPKQRNVKFPPYQPGKRLLRSTQAIERLEAQLVNGETRPISSPLLQGLLGPKRDLWHSTPSSTPDWLLLRIGRRLVPEAIAVEPRSSNGQRFVPPKGSNLRLETL